MFAQLVVERTREADLAELRRAVDGFAGKPAAPGLRRDRDEVAPTARDQVRDGRARGVDRPLEVDVDHLLEVLDRRVDECVVRADAGIRDADVQPSEALDRAGDRVLDLAQVADVAGQPERVRKPEVVAAS